MQSRLACAAVASRCCSLAATESPTHVLRRHRAAANGARARTWLGTVDPARPVTRSSRTLAACGCRPTSDRLAHQIIPHRAGSPSLGTRSRLAAAAASRPSPAASIPRRRPRHHAVPRRPAPRAACVRSARPSSPPAASTGKLVVLVDDVLFSGRSTRAALDALSELGRPRCRAAGRPRRSRPPRAADPGRLCRQEPADLADAERAGAACRDRRRGRRCTRCQEARMKRHLLSAADLDRDEALRDPRHRRAACTAMSRPAR